MVRIRRFGALPTTCRGSVIARRTCRRATSS
jgi:hypothetical protein